MIANKEVQYAKEIDDVMKLVVELVGDIRAKKDAMAVVSENLSNLIDAISGLDGVAQEVQDHKSVAMSTVGSRVGELIGVLVG